jgi:hypothetical protein
LASGAQQLQRLKLVPSFFFKVGCGGSSWIFVLFYVFFAGVLMSGVLWFALLTAQVAWAFGLGSCLQLRLGVFGSFRFFEGAFENCGW